VLGKFAISNGWLDPGAPVTIAGNIFGGQAGSSSGGGCVLRDSANAVAATSWAFNLIAATGTNAACAPSDRLGSAVFVNAGFPGAGLCGTGQLAGCALATGVPDLQLSGSQVAVDGGEASYCPAVDVMRTSRPRGNACDLGASESG
jgi:hypothetical protein